MVPERRAAYGGTRRSSVSKCGLAILCFSDEDLSVATETLHPTVWLAIYQGRYGGRSPKPTSLLIACRPGLDLAGHFKEFETSESLPQALKMGWNSEKHEFETAGLKNYPAALCECLAALAERWLKQHFHSPSGLTMVPMDEFIRFSDELVQTFNALVNRGADFHRSGANLHL